MTTIETETETDKLIRLQNETLFFLNVVKNSQAVHVGDGQVLTRLYTGQKIFVDASDISVAPALMMDGYLEREVTSLLTRLLRPSDCFVDVGTNMGYFGIVAGSVIRGEAGGSIHMIEANPRLVPPIFKSINVTGLLGTASVANYAVTDAAGQGQLQVVKDLMGSSSLIDLESQSREASRERSGVALEAPEKITVPAITLDAYVEAESLDEVNLIKIDSGGHEEQTYRGMVDVVAANREHLRILLTFHPARYDDGEGFHGRLAEDFAHLYGRDPETDALVELGTYEHLLAMASGGSATLLVTNQPELDP